MPQHLMGNAPRVVELVDELPRTTSGNVLRRVLRDR